MTALREGDLEIRFPRGSQARKFDDPASHGLTHCMKAVDFVVELSEKILFIEFKDPDHPAAVTGNRDEFVRRFQSGEIDSDLVRKYRDTLLYEWAAERLGKPVEYLVLVAIESLDEALLLSRTDEMRRRLPVQGPSNGAWRRTIAAGCTVFNIAAWNKALKPFPVRRVSLNA